MPSSYAHYRFGTQIIALMPADVRGPILRHRALFDMGLQGPDFLFYHNFIKATPLRQLGTAYHEKSGRDFFTQACAHLRQCPSEAGLAYLHGLLAHYCLDSACHPFVYGITNSEDAGHCQLETEFDRFLLELDGYKKPHTVNLSSHIRLQKDDYAAVAAFYPELSAADAALCIRHMTLALRLLTIPTKAGHGMVVKVTQLAGGNAPGMAMTVCPNPKWSHLDGKLLELYEQAMAGFPAHLEQLGSHMAYGAPFGDAFNVNFNRG